jgi:type I restriction enzyme R subunit
MDKRSLSERDICSKFITPAITAPGKWDLITQVREEVSFTAGRVLVRGKVTTRGDQKRADYILYHQSNRPLALKDLDGWRPERGQKDRDGNEIEDREYNARDFDRNLILTKRTEAVAAKVTAFLKATDRYAKTIVFCENIDHAERMRQALVNANADLAAANSKYVMRITGDNDEGKAQLDNFIDPEKTYPVIATTSKLMTTGVDAQTCKLIVLDQRIQSMTEFKQIIGRGTRINEDYGKLFFTIMDFKQATSLFADPDFDGDPVQVYEPTGDADVVPPDDEGEDGIGEDGKEYDPTPPDGILIDPVRPLGGDGRPRRYVVDNVPVTVATERVQYLDEHGKLITESLVDYSRRTVLGRFATLTDFLAHWNHAERKQAIIDELVRQGVFLDELADQVGHDYDAFDLVCHVAFNQPPLTRRERAERVTKRNVFAKYGSQARAVLNALLNKYADTGITSVESLDILNVDPLTDFGTPIEILRLFGGKAGYLTALHDLENALYSPSPSAA